VIRQLLNWLVTLKVSDPERKLYLAVPNITHINFFQKEFSHRVIVKYQLEIFVYGIENNLKRTHSKKCLSNVIFVENGVN